jgi:hypothetical protein
LPPNTTIYYKGYATNALGTGYSPEGSFSSLATPVATATSILQNLDVRFSPQFEEIGGEVLEDTLVPRRRRVQEAEYQEIVVPSGTTDLDVFPEQFTNLDILFFTSSAGLTYKVNASSDSITLDQYGVLGMYGGDVTGLTVTNSGDNDALFNMWSWGPVTLPVIVPPGGPAPPSPPPGPTPPEPPIREGLSDIEWAYNLITGPWQGDDNLTWYGVFRRTDNDKRLTVRKTTDWGATWASMDDAGFTALTNQCWSADSYKRNDYIHVAVAEDSTGRISYHRFETVTDTWDIFDEEVTASTTAITPCVSICTTIPTESYYTSEDGKPVIYYTGDKITVSGTPYERGYYKERYAVNVWGNGDAADTSETQVTNLGQLDAYGTTGTTVHMNSSRVIPGTNNRLHFFWTSQSSFKGEFYRTRPDGTKTLNTTTQWVQGNLFYFAVAGFNRNMGKYDWYQSPVAPYNVNFAFGFKGWAGDAFFTSFNDADSLTAPTAAQIPNIGGNVWEGASNSIDNGGYPAISIDTSTNNPGVTELPTRHWVMAGIGYGLHHEVYRYNNAQTPTGWDYRCGLVMDFFTEGSMQQSNASFIDNAGEIFILKFTCLDNIGPNIAFELYKVWNDDGTTAMPAPYITKTQFLALP